MQLNLTVNKNLNIRKLHIIKCPVISFFSRLLTPCPTFPNSSNTHPRHSVLCEASSSAIQPTSTCEACGNRCCVMSEMAKAPTMRSWTNNPACPERGSQLVPDMGRFPYYDHPIQMVFPRWMWQFDNLAGWKSHLCPIGNASTNGENSVPRQHKGNIHHRNINHISLPRLGEPRNKEINAATVIVLTATGLQHISKEQLQGDVEIDNFNPP